MLQLLRGTFLDLRSTRDPETLGGTVAYKFGDAIPLGGVRIHHSGMSASAPAEQSTTTPRRIFVAGATGYIGKHVTRELLRRGHQVVCFARRRAGVDGAEDEDRIRAALTGAEVRFGDVTDVVSIRAQGFRAERFDAMFSCLATRTGGIQDAQRVEYQANVYMLEAALEVGVKHFVLLSAICVQRPRLAFQRAKLAFERELVASGIDYSIVRPTAFFKSLSGQFESVRRGKPFVMFGDGERTACKPISEEDLARYMVECIEDPSRRNAVLAIGGPGPAITPRQQGALLFAALGRPPRYRRVPLALFDFIIVVLDALSFIFRGLRDKAEFARIGRYYATESMLVWNEKTGAYDDRATPSYGSDTLEAFYARAAADGLTGQELGDHALFARRTANDLRGLQTRDH